MKKTKNLIATSAALGLGMSVLESTAKATGQANYGAAGMGLAGIAPTVQGANIALESISKLGKIGKKTR